MLRVYYHSETEIKKGEGVDCLKQISFEKICWVDLQFPTDHESREVIAVFKIDFNKLKLENELESNPRFYESEDFIFISANFIALKENNFESTPVFIYLLNNVLITERNADLASFEETTKKIKRNRKGFKNGSDVLEGILETKFDFDADFIEQIAKNIASVGRSLSLKNSVDMEGTLLKISDYQEATTLSRESFIDKQRVASALLKSNVFDNKERLKILIKDINAMLEYTSFIFIRLEYLQNTLLGLINIEQNKTIKIFTIVAVVFMPPTLIASIYGMNFKSMPELSWHFGYPLAILLIVGSSLLTLYLFKRKKWL
ncbi:magnesium and cobalt transport protein CorA [Niastella yeongjuensis]|uniref:Magnesium transport protein CorA n=1 Tax=Niastella yeongjuensis TaxID=354355 RepID=A0A1V9FBV0_9BACT|nr:magnesium/cobalt transporter CorA [Niastella yeongjuensis]OQP55845.1 magnesium and cobalt transport protein CorA [Niastella yeongjuensis]SEP47337.1 magnesium transporter [Niastella yeongjuensis]